MTGSSARCKHFVIEWIKEYDRDTCIRLAHTQTSEVSEHANETRHSPLWDKVKFIDHNPCTHRVKEAVHIRLHPNNIIMGNEIEIPEAVMPMIKQHNSHSVPQ